MYDQIEVLEKAEAMLKIVSDTKTKEKYEHTCFLASLTKLITGININLTRAFETHNLLSESCLTETGFKQLVEYEVKEVNSAIGSIIRLDVPYGYKTMHKTFCKKLDELKQTVTSVVNEYVVCGLLNEQETESLRLAIRGYVSYGMPLVKKATVKSGTEIPAQGRLGRWIRISCEYENGVREVN